MKKNLTIIFAVALSFGVFAQQNTWPSALGNVSFATDSTWTISGNGIFQIWSDAVQTDYCSNKTEFHGGDLLRNLSVDCRSNPNLPGDLFSWQAVFDLRNELCPYPWRVPKREDFINLDIALGGTGNNRPYNTENIEFVKSKYITIWNGAFGGDSQADGTLRYQGSWGAYWSQTERLPPLGFTLSFGTDGTVGPQGWTTKSSGLGLRCVRDN